MEFGKKRKVLSALKPDVTGISQCSQGAAKVRTE